MRRVLQLLGWNVGAAVVVTAMFSGVTSQSTWQVVGANFAIGLLFSICISMLCYFVLSRLGPVVASAASPPVYWVVMVLSMVVLAFAGSLIALLLLSGTGLLPLEELLGAMQRSLRASLVITVAIGVSITVIETLRGRLERVQLALRTKERDEADARRAATEAQLASLESRVQPHFLFNTLNSIAALIPQDPAGAERMTGQLASLLRSSLDAGPTPLVPLRDELRVVGDYLEIERVRFGARLRYDLSAPAELDELQVPRLALQTLVENAVKFAVSSRREGGRIVVSAAIDGQRAVLSVEDDGPGFDPSAVPQHHGLALLRERLRLSYGDDASLLIDTHPDRTRVTMVLPR